MLWLGYHENTPYCCKLLQTYSNGVIVCLFTVKTQYTTVIFMYITGKSLLYITGNLPQVLACNLTIKVQQYILQSYLFLIILAI